MSSFFRGINEQSSKLVVDVFVRGKMFYGTCRIEHEEYADENQNCHRHPRINHALHIMVEGMNGARRLRGIKTHDVRPHSTDEVPTWKCCNNWGGSVQLVRSQLLDRIRRRLSSKRISLFSCFIHLSQAGTLLHGRRSVG